MRSFDQLYRHTLFLSWAALLTGVPVAATADLLVLRNGSRIEGRVRLETHKDSGAQYYLIQLENDTFVGIPKGEVKAHLQETPALAEYRQKADQAGDSAEAHWELSKWCRANGLVDQAKRHIQRVVSIDPDHGAARAALGETKFAGRWMPKAQMQRQRGLVYKDGQWQIPEMAALTEDSKSSDANIRIWRTKIKRLRERVNSARYGTEAMAELRAIIDPEASTAIAELALDENESLAMRELYLDLLANWDTPPAINAVITLGLSSNPTLRERALNLVKSKAPEKAAATYTQLLRDNNYKLVRRAAIALAHVPQSDSMLPLIDALITRHKSIEQPASSGLSPTFTSNGAGGLSSGGKPKVVIQDVQNQDVLSALISLQPGVNYQFDEDRWRAWYAQRAEYSSSLRRDP